MNSHTDLVRRRKCINVYKNSKQDQDNISDYRCGKILMTDIIKKPKSYSNNIVNSVKQNSTCKSHNDIVKDRICNHIYKSGLKTTKSIIQYRLGNLYDLESKPLESKPLESKPLELKPLESKPLESKPVLENINKLECIYNPDSTFVSDNIEYGNEQTKEMYVDGLTKALSSSEKIETPKKCVSTLETKERFNSSKEFWKSKTNEN
jgi:hypothetical protein|tara:strand:- start:276 stop:893 length:618 start_codon:yes stop_codon:yes gene_type:complete